MTKQVSAFAMPRGLSEPSASAGSEPDPMPDLDDPRVARAMSEMERDMEHLDENNPRHIAQMIKKMKDLMPAGSVPKPALAAAAVTRATADCMIIDPPRLVFIYKSFVLRLAVHTVS
jgi:hypothetical protein